MKGLSRMQRLRGESWLTKPFVFFSLVMLLKAYLAKFVIYSDSSGWLPTLTGLPSAWLVFSLIEWLAPKRKFGAYLIADLVMTSIYFAVIMYYKYFGVIVTYHALQQFGQITEVSGSVFSLLHPYFLLIYTDLVVLFVVLAVNRRFRRWSKLQSAREPRRVIAAVLLLALLACTANVLENRGSINELKQAENMGILNYEGYAMINGVVETVANSHAEAGRLKRVTPGAIAQLKGNQESSSPLLQGQAKGDNLIVIQLEAFQNFLLNQTIEGAEITPNLNALLAETLYFPHFYQMVGQGNTADAEYVVNTSFLVPSHGAASQDYGDVQLPSLPRLLAENGYDTTTFHTNDAKFWNRQELYKALGFGHYYDKAFFGNDDQVFLGSSDEVLYTKTADRLLDMSNTGKPFYAQIISMSGHHPFSLPDRKIRFKLPEAYRGTLVGHYIEAQNYADYALGQFIARLKSNGLWENSVVVIYGDHMGLPIYSLTAQERDLMRELLGGDYGFPQMLNVPLIVSVPGVKPQVMTQTGGQADILPTAANLLGISLKNRVYFGQDLLNQTSNLLPERYYLPSGSFINDKGIFVPGEDFADGSLYKLDGSAPVSSEVSEDQYRRALELLRLSDAYVAGLPKFD